jgi:DNA-binding LacI/PurR family transcriptional regulator
MTPDTPLPQRISLVTQTVQSLSHAIREGRWHAFLPGERELCEMLQVSRRTLRVALAELQRQGWLETVARHRRRIKTRRPAHLPKSNAKVIGILTAEPVQTLKPQTLVILDILRDKLTRAGCHIELHSSRTGFSSRPAAALEKLVHQHPATAWLILGSKEPMQRWFIRQHIPCLILGSCTPGIALPSLDVDYQAACRHAGNLLWRKGHRHFAFVLPHDAYGGDEASEKGLREALVDPAAHLHVLRHNRTPEHLCSLLEKAMRSPNAPTAFVVAHGMPVVTVITELLRSGRRIPRDVAIVSRDDDFFLKAVRPTVAHYSVDRASIARRLTLAVRQLTESGTLPPGAIRLMPRFVPGGTV